MIIDFSTIDFKERPTLVLRNADGKAIQALQFAHILQAEIYYNEISSITFDLPAYVDEQKTPYYDDVIGMRIIDVVGYGQFILVNPVVKNDGLKEIKSCKAYSLEYELTYKKMSLEEGTYNFWNPLSPDSTVMGIILSYLPSWKIGHIDEALIDKYRTFSEKNVNIYNFIKSTLQDTYSCIFDFDTYKREINVRAVSSVVNTKPIYISFDNLAKNIEISEDTENIFTVLDVNGAEGVDIRSVNPMGTNKIYNLDYYMNSTNFSSQIINKWTQWKQAYSESQQTYYNLTIESMLITSAIVTKKAELNELRNNDLAILENRRSVYIEQLASLPRSSDDYDTFQALLSNTNSAIRTLENKIAQVESSIEDLEDNRDTITSRLRQINNSVSFQSFFTTDELEIIDRYFKEDSISESSFVFSDVDSYSSNGTLINIEQENITITNSDRELITSNNGNTNIYTLAGGAISMPFDSSTITANIINASLEYHSDNSFILSCYIGNGSIASNAFKSATLSVVGDMSSITVSGSSIVVAIDSCSVYFTQNLTEYEKYQVEWELYKYGIDCLNKLSHPSYSFDIDAANFLMLEEFDAFAKKLTLGDKLYLSIKSANNTDADVIEPIFIGVTIDFENPQSFKLNFGDKYNLASSMFELSDLLEQSVSMGKTVDTSRFNYNNFIDSGASTVVKEFIRSALDVSKNAILSSNGMSITWDSSGIKCKKQSVGGGYDPEQLAIINNSIVFTDDAWNTAKMAIGKIIDENIVKYNETTDTTFNENKTYYYLNSGEYTAWTGGQNDWASRPTLYEKDATAYGIVAPYIVGTLLAGESLVIESAKKSGGVSVFRVDSEGAFLHNADFNIVSNNTQISLNASCGIGIGTYPLYNQDGLITNNAKFWVDASGNVNLKGTLQGCDGTFNGIIKASDFQDLSGTSMLVNKNNEYKFKADYLSLKGIEVKNGSNTTTFKVDSSGNVTVSGNITLGSGSTIDWNNVSESHLYNNEAYSLADSAYDNITALADGTYSGGTFINKKVVSSPTIRGGYIVGGKFFAVSNPNRTITNGDISGVARITIDSNGIQSYDSNDNFHGFVAHPSDINYNDGYSFYTRGYEMINTARYVNDISTQYYGFRNGLRTYFGEIRASASKGMMTVSGSWDFSSATVTGIVARFA
ncbi:MAG: hypothetical protein IJT38_05530 [Clostridia bacterium]|nr:hypothetical protein [Clostridia bacterium]